MINEIKLNCSVFLCDSMQCILYWNLVQNVQPILHTLYNCRSNTHGEKEAVINSELLTMCTNHASTNLFGQHTFGCMYITRVVLTAINQEI